MEGTIGEIRMFAGNFAPRAWAFCQNQILSIAQNTALFSILGTTYGGNGQTTFALPDFRGRVAVGTGQGPGLPSVQLGELSGSTSHTLLITEMPAHNHTLAPNGTSAKATVQIPADGVLLGKGVDNVGTAQPLMYAPAGTTPAVTVGSSTTGINGGSQPFSLMQPYLGMNYIICLQGIFPSRN